MKKSEIGNIRKSQVIFFGIITPLIILILLILTIQNNIDFNILLFLNMVSIILSLFIVSMDDRVLSLNKIYGYFMIIFMGIAPYCNNISNYSSWNYILEERYIIKAHIIVLIWNVIYIISYLWFNRKNYKFKNKSTLYNDEHMIPLFVLFSIIAFGYACYSIGFNNLLTRGENHINEGTAIDIVIDFIIRFAPTISLFLLINVKKYSITTWISIVLVGIITFILNYPVSNSRFNTAAVGLSILLAVVFKNVDKVNRNSRIFDWFIIIGTIVIFPILRNFKSDTLTGVINSGIEFNVIDSFNNVDFDAFSFIGRGLKYVDVYGFTYGKQIMSTIFFFVPRAILPIKGDPSGSLIVNAQVPGAYDNVSCPLIMEFFLDFGYIGLVVAPVFLAFLFVKMDKYREYIVFEKKCVNNYYLSIYSLFFSFQIYILRGALAPTFLRLMGAILVVILFKIINYILYKFDFRLKSISEA